MGLVQYTVKDLLLGYGEGDGTASHVKLPDFHYSFRSSLTETKGTNKSPNALTSYGIRARLNSVGLCGSINCGESILNILTFSISSTSYLYSSFILVGLKNMLLQQVRLHCCRVWRFITVSANFDCNQTRTSAAIYSKHTRVKWFSHTLWLVLWQQELKLEISFKDEIKICPIVLTLA